MSSYTAIILLIILFFCVRLFSTVFSSRPRKLATKPLQPCSVAIFLGSGGHTGEALKLVSALDFSRYTPRTYIISEGDVLSARKALALEHLKATQDDHFIPPPYKLLTIPRARRVHQSLLSTPPDAVKSLLACIYLLSVRPLFKKGPFRHPFADLLILNGPGTCVFLCAAILLNRATITCIILICDANQLIGLPSPRVMYIESFARVKSLSLSGKLLYHFADRFVVQWPDLVQPWRSRRLSWMPCMIFTRNHNCYLIDRRTLFAFH
ncbi:glycosyltransferase family 1 protein [Suillus paluster]|uniref:glycosyltransferase family 1 protein n=1 Tax=Suillus paluster TaxID=48578 RepID=UPI001B85C222|nr:glycosyltransferase family 1 protein [Suillus paluster]KAG1732217.1 glycosyltransferase family 1 protein [Suillus paluster]